ncbi:ABC-type microcin C transport system permease subunit YejB [Flavobacterium piscis]|uniref:ABC-type microcin C transport system permease subunit YejB n=1 Tax=Flavobacterium piscis TaxID=1114874 RepID=A0ABU1Y928_9FLAO|nr:ABC-type microcin C transport system permease subunit YejB [Flavobacterium piscis]
MILILKNYGFDISKNKSKKKLVSNYLKRVFYNKEINNYLLLSLILAFLPVSSLK